MKTIHEWSHSYVHAKIWAFGVERQTSFTDFRCHEQVLHSQTYSSSIRIAIQTVVCFLINLLICAWVYNAMRRPFSILLESLLNALARLLPYARPYNGRKGSFLSSSSDSCIDAQLIHFLPGISKCVAARVSCTPRIAVQRRTAFSTLRIAVHAPICFTLLSATSYPYHYYSCSRSRWQWTCVFQILITRNSVTRSFVAQMRERLFSALNIVV